MSIRIVRHVLLSIACAIAVYGYFYFQPLAEKTDYIKYTVACGMFIGFAICFVFFILVGVFKDLSNMKLKRK